MVTIRRKRPSSRSISAASPCTLETLETRALLSGSPFNPPAPGDPYLYAPHSKVEGKTMSQWAAAWWQSVFSAPVFASDGTTIVNPNFADAPTGIGDAHGNVGLLYQAFDAPTLTRGSASDPLIASPQTPLFLNLDDSEWSNPDTPSSESGYTQVPGNYTSEQLQHFADVQTGAVTHLSLSIDGHAIPESVLFTHRETTPNFSYNLPDQFNIDQVFFSEDISGKVSPAAADGYCVMLKPLSPGLHIIEVGAQNTDLSATPPQLAAADSHYTYYIKVVPDHPGQHDGHQANTPHSPASNCSDGNPSPSNKNDDLLGRLKHLFA